MFFCPLRYLKKCTYALGNEIKATFPRSLSRLLSSCLLRIMVELRLSAIRKMDISQDVNKLVGNLVADKRLAANCVCSRDCFVSYYNKSAANLPLIYCN